MNECSRNERNDRVSAANARLLKKRAESLFSFLYVVEKENEDGLKSLSSCQMNFEIRWYAKHIKARSENKPDNINMYLHD